jgi:Tfp pilus assembly protein PilO
MNRKFELRKTIVRWALVVAVVLDLGLVGLNWRMARAPHAPAGELARLNRQREMMEGDLRRGDEIQKELPAIALQDDRFFHEQFRPLPTGYSDLVADLNSLAVQAGLHVDSTTFDQHSADSHGIVQVNISESVEGNYQSLITFLNALQRSKNFYILDGLGLSSSMAGNVRLSLQLRTFFRT